MPSQAIYYSRFKPTYDLGGGSRRMMQIYELLARIIPELRLVTPSGDNGGGGKLEKKKKNGGKTTQEKNKNRK